MAYFSLQNLRCFVFVALAFVGAPAVSQEVLSLHVSHSSSAIEPVVLDIAALDAFEQVEFTTTTVWTDGPQTFSGVALKHLLSALGAQGEEVELTALNDYLVSLPIADLEEDAPLIATRINGETMSVRDKGPFWLVFPYDKHPKYNTEQNLVLSIWQLNRVMVVD